MRNLLMITAASVFVVACNDSDMPSGEEMENDAEQAVDATGDALENAGEALADAADRVGSEMDELGEDIPVREVNGRWGITAAGRASAPDDVASQRLTLMPAPRAARARMLLVA